MGTPKNIYLAGKISPNDWRSEIVNSLLLTSQASDEDAILYQTWGFHKKAIFGKHNYTGPFFMGMDDHCGPEFHGDNTHGVSASTSLVDISYCGHEYAPRKNTKKQKYVKDLCLTAIDHSDIVFAWITDTTCYGTISELGYAKAKNKLIFIAGPERFDDLWFVYSMANAVDFSYDTPSAALKEILGRLDQLEIIESLSPIEKQFWECWGKEIHFNVDSPFDLHRDYKSIEPQYELLGGKYRLDFAHVPTKTAIELDGLVAHSSTEQIANDRRRQREIEGLGWRFIRFGGKEVFHDVESCVGETATFIIKEWDRLGLHGTDDVDQGVVISPKLLPEPTITPAPILTEEQRSKKALDLFNARLLD